jgi:hypothetical protein
VSVLSVELADFRFRAFRGYQILNHEKKRKARNEEANQLIEGAGGWPLNLKGLEMATNLARPASPNYAAGRFPIAPNSKVAN